MPKSNQSRDEFVLELLGGFVVGGVCGARQVHLNALDARHGLGVDDVALGVGHRAYSTVSVPVYTSPCI